MGLARHGLALLVALSVSACGPVSEKDAKKFATDRFKQVCSDLSYQQSLFTGPYKTTAGNTAYAYEWHTKSSNGLGSGAAKFYGVLVSIKSDGDAEAALMDRPLNFSPNPP